MFSTFCYVTALFQNELNSLFSSKFCKQYPIMTTWKIDWLTNWHVFFTESWFTKHVHSHSFCYQHQRCSFVPLSHIMTGLICKAAAYLTSLDNMWPLIFCAEFKGRIIQNESCDNRDADQTLNSHAISETIQCFQCFQLAVGFDERLPNITYNKIN